MKGVREVWSRRPQDGVKFAKGLVQRKRGQEWRKRKQLLAVVGRDCNVSEAQIPHTMSLTISITPRESQKPFELGFLISRRR